MYFFFKDRVGGSFIHFSQFAEVSQPIYTSKDIALVFFFQKIVSTIHNRVDVVDVEFQNS